ncbi:uncharacterized protein LOC117105569 [Anneissia japonica]|uniref:uncharacterized protein LOC117105569 n=1 Tax=Anneissia japonica TaxID=1529436 RepID=UPI001425AAE1|nr:uncharacterized protein LOC117105569 [Anneissia japonica]
MGYHVELAQRRALKWEPSSIPANAEFACNDAGTSTLSKFKVEDSLLRIPDYHNNLHSRAWSVHPRPIGKRTLVLYDQRSTHETSDFGGEEKKQQPGTSVSFGRKSVGTTLNFLHPSHTGGASTSDGALQFTELGQPNESDDTETSDNSERHSILRQGNTWFDEARKQGLVLKPNKGSSDNISNLRQTAGSTKRVWTAYRRPPSWTRGLNTGKKVEKQKQVGTRMKVSDMLVKLQKLGVLAWR